MSYVVNFVMIHTLLFTDLTYTIFIATLLKSRLTSLCFMSIQYKPKLYGIGLSFGFYDEPC